MNELICGNLCKFAIGLRSPVIYIGNISSDFLFETQYCDGTPVDLAVTYLHARDNRSGGGSLGIMRDATDR